MAGGGGRQQPTIKEASSRARGVVTTVRYGRALGAPSCTFTVDDKVFACNLPYCYVYYTTVATVYVVQAEAAVWDVVPAAVVHAAAAGGV